MTNRGTAMFEMTPEEERASRKWFWIVMGALLLMVSCSIVCPIGSPDPPSTVTINGHHYIQINYRNGSGETIHDPDCPCHGSKK